MLIEEYAIRYALFVGGHIGKHQFICGVELHVYCIHTVSVCLVCVAVPMWPPHNLLRLDGAAVRHQISNLVVFRDLLNDKVMSQTLDCNVCVFYLRLNRLLAYLRFLLQKN